MLSESGVNGQFDFARKAENHENQSQFCRRTDPSDVRSLSDRFVDDVGDHRFDLLLLPEHQSDSNLEVSDCRGHRGRDRGRSLRAYRLDGDYRTGGKENRQLARAPEYHRVNLVRRESVPAHEELRRSAGRVSFEDSVFGVSRWLVADGDLCESRRQAGLRASHGSNGTRSVAPAVYAAGHPALRSALKS